MSQTFQARLPDTAFMTTRLQRERKEMNYRLYSRPTREFIDALLNLLASLLILYVGVVAVQAFVARMSNEIHKDKSKIVNRWIRPPDRLP